MLRGVCRAYRMTQGEMWGSLLVMGLDFVNRVRRDRFIAHRGQ
jgi:hypothetical protein